MTEQEFFAGLSKRLDNHEQKVVRHHTASQAHGVASSDDRAASVRAVEQTASDYDYTRDDVEYWVREGLRLVAAGELTISTLPSHLAPSTEGRTASAGSSPSGREHAKKTREESPL